LFFYEAKIKAKGLPGKWQPLRRDATGSSGHGDGTGSTTQPAFGSFVPDCFYFSKPLLTRVTIKSLYLPHCLSKPFGFSKRVEAARVASFLNPVRIVVLVKDDNDCGKGNRSQ
jgi:hypothetical protein